MAQHDGRVIATGERSYALRFCNGTLTVDAARLVVQGAPHGNGRDRKPVTTERAGITTLHLTCGLFGATLKRELPSGHRSLVIRVRGPKPLLADLREHAWPVQVSGWRRPKD